MCNRNPCPGFQPGEPHENLGTVIECIQAVTDLMLPQHPQDDLHLIRRDKLYALMDFLAAHLEAAAEEVRHAD